MLMFQPNMVVPLTIRRSLPGRLALGRGKVRDVFLISLLLGTLLLLYAGHFGPWTPKTATIDTTLTNTLKAPRFQPTVVKIEWNDTKVVLHKVLHGIKEADEFLRQMEKPQRPVNVTAETIKSAYDHDMKKHLLEGTLLRVLLTKQPLKIGVIGGSISEGKILAGESYIYYNILANLLSRMLNRTVEIRNAVVPASDSRYYSYCLSNHVNLHDVHIVLWELAVNDHLALLRPYSQEELTRHVLMQPSQPQMVYVNFVNVVNLWRRRCATNERSGSLQLGAYYKIPSISLTNATCSDIRRGWAYYLNAPDNYHPSRRAHRLMAIFITHLFRDALVNIAHNLLSSSQVRYIQRLNNAAIEATKLPPPYYPLSRNIRPHCWSSVGDTPDDLVPVSFNGWEKQEYINEEPRDMIKEVVRFYNKTVWISFRAHSRIAFSIYIEPYEDYLAIVSITTIGCPDCGRANVHVDNKVETTKTIFTHWKYWTRVMTHRVASYITPGQHTVTITNMDNKPLTILAIMTAYDVTKRTEDLRDILPELREGEESSESEAEVEGLSMDEEDGVPSEAHGDAEDELPDVVEDDDERVKEEYDEYQKEIQEEDEQKKKGKKVMETKGKMEEDSEEEESEIEEEIEKEVEEEIEREEEEELEREEELAQAAVEEMLEPSELEEEFNEDEQEVIEEVLEESEE